MATGNDFRLYLLRHAHAAWPLPGTQDFDRPLDAQGESEARDVAEQALMAGFRPQVIVSSPAARCRQTAEAMARLLCEQPIAFDQNLYSNGEDSYRNLIIANQHRGSLMIVGHNPMIEALAHHLTQASELTGPIDMGYPTAGLLALDMQRPLVGDLFKIAVAAAMIVPSFA